MKSHKTISTETVVQTLTNLGGRSTGTYLSKVLQQIEGCELHVAQEAIKLSTVSGEVKLNRDMTLSV